VQNSEEEHHVVKREYNSSRVETSATETERNKPQAKANNIRDQGDDIEDIPTITNVSF